MKKMPRMEKIDTTLSVIMRAFFCPAVRSRVESIPPGKDDGCEE